MICFGGHSSGWGVKKIDYSEKILVLFRMGMYDKKSRRYNMLIGNIFSIYQHFIPVEFCCITPTEFYQNNILY
jgi:hypothetical protein